MKTLDNLPGWARQPNQPNTYPRTFLEVAVERGVAREAALSHAGLPVTALDDPGGRISFLDTLKIFDAVRTLTGDSAVGFQTGPRLPLTAHGSLGYALMCAGTPREAIGILQRFWHLRGRGVLMTLTESEDLLFFEIIPEAPIPPALRNGMFSSILTSISQGMQFVLPMLPADRVIWLQGNQPEGFERLQNGLPRVRFNMPRSGIALHGDLSWLDQPLPTANPEALSQAITQCERESALFDSNDNIVRQTRASLSLSVDGYPTPEMLATQMHLTPRTLRRRLQEQGHSYKHLLEEARRRDSCHLLANSGLEVQRIGNMLGFADPANFTRAFKTWTGLTPSQWRQQYGTHR